MASVIREKIKCARGNEEPSNGRLSADDSRWVCFNAAADCDSGIAGPRMVDHPSIARGFVEIAATKLPDGVKDQAAGGAGGYDTVRRYARTWAKERGSVTAQAYMPLYYAPGEAYQFDWSHEIVVLNGVTTTVKVAHIRLCHSRMMYVRAYLCLSTECRRERKHPVAKHSRTMKPSSVHVVSISIWTV